MAPNPYVLAGAGAVGGAISAVGESARNRKYYEDLVKGAGTLKGQVDQDVADEAAAIVKQYGYIPETASQDIKDYIEEVKNADFSQFDAPMPEDFSFDYAAETKAQMNPELDAIIGKATGSVQQSAANRGSLFSGAAGRGVATAAANETAKEYDVAAQRAMQIGQQKYQQFNDKFNNILRTLEVNKGNYQSGLEAKGSAAGMEQKGLDAKSAREQEIQDAADATKLQIENDRIKNEASANSQPGFWESLFTGAISGGSKGLTAASGIT